MENWGKDWKHFEKEKKRKVEKDKVREALRKPEKG